MIKLKNILLKEEMSPREKREMKASTRNIILKNVVDVGLHR